MLNACGGEVVDEAALIETLQSEHLARGIDEVPLGQTSTWPVNAARLTLEPPIR